MNHSTKDEETLLSLIDGTISEPEFRALRARMENEKELRALYRRMCEFEFAVTELFPKLNIPRVVSGTEALSLIARKKRNLWPAFAAAAVLTLIATILGLQTYHGKASEQTVSLEFSPSSVITGQEDSAFPTQLEKGKPMNLQHGHVGLSFQEGKVKAVLESPAEFTVSKENQIQVRSGRVFVSVGQGADPISCKVGDYLIEDIGTVFGFHAVDGKLEELIVSDGKVRISSTKSVQTALLGPGKGVTTGENGITPLDTPDFSTYRRTVDRQESFFAWSPGLDPALSLFSNTVGGVLSNEGMLVFSPTSAPATTWLEMPSALPTADASNFSIIFPMTIPPDGKIELDSQVGLSLFNGGKERIFIGKVQQKAGWVAAIYPESGLRAEREIIPLDVSEEYAAFRIHFDQPKMDLALHARTSRGWNKVLTRTLSYTPDFDRIRLMANHSPLRLEKIEVFSEK